MAAGSEKPISATGNADIDKFLADVAAAPRPAAGKRGRLIFAMDATLSRQPTWDLAIALQSEMFEVVAALGGLAVQLVYFRGRGECRASHWTEDAAALAGLMSKVGCRGGSTQIARVLRHAAAEARSGRVGALVYVGDCMEENVDELAHLAGELGLLGLPAFLFQEGDDARAATAFREVARLSSGAYCRFDAGAAAELRALLRAVAVYASGGRTALAALGRAELGAGPRLLLEQLERRS
jgi:hypothetical protein